MEKLSFFLVSGLCQGALIALIALGYSLVYGVIKLINFAHGEFFMVGAYAGLMVYWMLPAGLSPWLSLPLVLLASGAAGALVAGLTEWAAYKPVRRSGRLAALLTAIGVSFLLQSLFGLATQARVLSYQGGADELAHRPIGVGAGGVTAIELAYLPLSLLLALGLWLLVMKTRFGRAMRAVSQDADAAAAMGVNLDRLIRWTFVLAGLLAGVAGTLYALLNGLTPTMGFRPGILAFIAAVVGGIGSLPGTLAGGFLIGLLAGAVDCFGVPSAYRDVAAFGLLIIFLVARPQGLLGPQEQEKV